MDKNGGGAKPKTGTGASARNGRQGTSESTGTRSDNGNGQANQGSYARTFRSNHSSNNNNNSNTASNGDNSVVTNDNITRRGSLPNSVARNRYATRANSQRLNLDCSSMVGRHSGSSAAGQNQGRRPFIRPALVHNNSKMKNTESTKKTEKADKTDKAVPLSPVSNDTSSLQSNVSTDSELPVVDNPDPQRSVASTSSVQETGVDDSVSVRLSTNSSPARPMSTSRDAALARQLMQEDMQAMMSADEELARQLQEELNGAPNAHQVLFNPMRSFGFDDSQEVSPEASSPETHSPPPFPQVVGRSRFYPSRPFVRSDDLRRRRGRGGGGMHVLMRTPGGQGAIGVVPRAGGEGGGGMRLLMGGLRRRGQRASDSTDDEGANLPQGEFDPDERLLAGGHPEDFLSIMHDPSLMLLMLLLRAPDTLNEGGVDLDDYEGLWELAERLGEVRRRGITEDEINQLPTHKFKAECSGSKVDLGAAAAEAVSVQCQICLVDFETGDSLRSIPCKHDFHKDCIDEWLKRNATCPICRQEIKPS